MRANSQAPVPVPDSIFGHHRPDDLVVTAGFVIADVDTSDAARKLLVTRLHARMAAVDGWRNSGERLTHRVLAERIGMSERWLSYQFPIQSELYAFPPPELALSLSGAAKNVTGWEDVANMVGRVFSAMESNAQGRMLMAGLVRLHRAHPALCEHDGHFAHSLREAIRSKRPRPTLAIAGLFTDGIRTAFEDWVDAGEPDLDFVALRVAELLLGPVQAAFIALSDNPG